MPELPMAVTAIAEADFTDWLEMRHALWPDHPKEELRAEMAELAADERAAAFIARDRGGAPLGFVEAFIRPFANGCDSRPVPFLEGIWIDPAARRHGIGRWLITAIESWAAQRGFVELGSDALLDNAASHAAHAGWGFAETERVVHFRKMLAPAGGVR